VAFSEKGLTYYNHTNMSFNRQLAAIMFTDIVGYTSMMQEDEDTTFHLLSRNREIQRPLIEQHGGRWVKEIGDGILATFTTISDAVTCAGKIISACKPVHQLQLRIGIHHAEVIFQDEDVFGDGVNIAARIQAIAPVNGIYVTESVHKNITNKKGFHSRFVREEILKHINESVRLYEVTVEENHTHSLANNFHISKPQVSDKSIAVLPFVNMSNDPEQEYFSDGMAEEILYSLGQIKDLKVAGRASSFQFKTKHTDVKEIGEKLGVNTVLEGSVRKQGKRLRINVELINTKDGYRLWSERYERDMDDVFAMQDEIALAITKKLKVTLLKKNLKANTKTLTRNTEAYEMYLKGRFHINRRGMSILKGIDYFQQAIEIDPDFALAHTGLADATLLAAFHGMVPPSQVIEKAKLSADKALKLDPSLCEPYCSLGYYSCLVRNWKDTEYYFKKSIEINPEFTQAHYWYGLNYLTWVKGDFDEAKVHGLTSIQLEPLSPICFGIYGGILNAAGKFEQAIAVCNEGAELDPDSFLCHLYIGHARRSLHQYEQSLAVLEHLLPRSGRHCFVVGAMIATYIKMGNVEKAQQLRHELKERSQKEYIVSTAIAISAALLDDFDEAMKYFEKGLQEGEPLLLTLKYEHWISEKMQEDVRFRNLLNLIGFP
jgi:adenylate cyclase